jgi:hypothetical protein
MLKTRRAKVNTKFLIIFSLNLLVVLLLLIFGPLSQALWVLKYLCSVLSSLILILVIIVMILGLLINNDEHPLRGDIIIGAVILLSIVGNLFGLLWYHCGCNVLSGQRNLYMFFFFARPGFFLLFLCGYIYQFVRFAKRVGSLSDTVSRFVLLFLTALAAFVCPRLYSTGPEHFMRGLSRSVKQQLDIPGIQKWLSKQKVPEKKSEPEHARLPYYMKGVGLTKVGVGDQPDSVKIISQNEPIYVFYGWDEKKFYIFRRESVLLPFSKHFECHIVIGQAGKAIPTPEEGPYGKKIVEFGPGAYAWYQVQH